MRFKHIDRMRAIAVLCMVEVHTAAIVPPEGITVGHPAAFVAAAFGGMAAPMFVTISGWGMYRSAGQKSKANRSFSNWVSWIIPRVVLLCLCQILVNLLLNVNRGGRFEWQTPGVLTLLAIAALLCPLLVRMSYSQRSVLMFIICTSPLLIWEATGPEMGWFQRVNSNGAVEWLARLLWNGTYPAIPWLFYVVLGTILHDMGGQPELRDKGIAIGLVATTITVFLAIVEGIDWALTSGDAILTFFPASMPFLVVSGTMVALSMRLLEGDEASGGRPAMGDRLSFLEPAGRLSLTIYVSHFAVLGLVAFAIEGEPRLGLIPAFAATVAHTLVWIPLAYLHERAIPGFSLEGLLRTSQSRR